MCCKVPAGRRGRRPPSSGDASPPAWPPGRKCRLRPGWPFGRTGGRHDLRRHAPNARLVGPQSIGERGARRAHGRVGRMGASGAWGASSAWGASGASGTSFATSPEIVDFNLPCQRSMRNCCDGIYSVKFDLFCQVLKRLLLGVPERQMHCGTHYRYRSLLRNELGLERPGVPPPLVPPPVPPTRSTTRSAARSTRSAGRAAAPSELARSIGVARSVPMGRSIRRGMARPNEREAEEQALMI